MPSFPAAPPVPLAEDIGGEQVTPRPCTCALCDEANAANAGLSRRGATQVTVVWTKGKEPGHKAFVSLKSGHILIGVGHSEAQAVVAALHSDDVKEPAVASLEAPITLRGAQ